VYIDTCIIRHGDIIYGTTSNKNDNGLTAALRDRDNFTGECRSCEYRNYCGGCRARAYRYGSDFLGDDPGCTIVQNSKIDTYNSMQ
jgi:radical SAM protein with 4Fe4S-binding SPASM domain